MVDLSFVNDFRVSLGGKASNEWDYDHGWYKANYSMKDLFLIGGSNQGTWLVILICNIWKTIYHWIITLYCGCTYIKGKWILPNPNI